MIVLGAVLVLVFGLYALVWVLSEDLDITFVVLFFLTILGVGLWVYDVASPVEVTESVIITNEPERYDIAVDKKEETLVTIRKVKAEAVRFGAIWNDSNKYYLILEEEE